MLKHFPSNKITAGCDESGRGSLAGPVVAAAVILPKKFKNKILNDSKILSKKKRELLRQIIEEEAISWAIGIVGDDKYKKKYKKLKNIDMGLESLISKLNRQFLHAKTLGFIHPKTDEKMVFSSILPQELNNLLKTLRNTNE